jgi:hypothetical protein
MTWVTIEIDTPTILAQDTDYKKIISLCEKGKFAEAKPILKKLIGKESNKFGVPPNYGTNTVGRRRPRRSN